MLRCPLFALVVQLLGWRSLGADHRKAACCVELEKSRLRSRQRSHGASACRLGLVFGGICFAISQSSQLYSEPSLHHRDGSKILHLLQAEDLLSGSAYCSYACFLTTGKIGAISIPQNAARAIWHFQYGNQRNCFAPPSPQCQGTALLLSASTEGPVTPCCGLWQLTNETMAFLPQVAKPKLRAR